MRKIIFSDIQNQTLEELFHKYNINKSVEIPKEFNIIYQTNYNYLTLYRKFVSLKKCITGKRLSEVNIKKRKNIIDTITDLSSKRFKEHITHQSDTDSENLDDQYIKNLNHNNDSDNDNNSEFELNSTSLNKNFCKCGSISHKRITNKLCPLNHNNLQLRNSYNIGKCEFNEILIEGANIINGRLYIGQLNIHCHHCHALLFKEERNKKKSTINKPVSSICCSDGKVKLPIVEEPSKLICKLLDDKMFMTNIRAYNSCLAFTSMGVNLDKNYANNLKGMYTFRIHGSIYHRIGSLTPSLNTTPKFAQLYIHDTDNEIDNRLLNFSGLDKKILLELQKEMHKLNPYVKMFKQLSLDLIHEPSIKMVIKSDNKIDRKIKNLPNISEIAAIIPGDEDSFDTCKRDIIIENKNDNLTHIDQFNSSYDSLQYVLPFMRGNLGYEFNIKQQNSTKSVSCMQYYSYALQIRDLKKISVNNFGRLFQQYCVDMYAKIEQERLNFIRSETGQNKIRAEMYKNVQDHIHENLNDKNDLSEFGKRIILPSTFVGGPRHMRKLYQNAMAIIRKYGKPDLFITFTCNSNWPEIKEIIRKGEDPLNRPDICARIFNLKFKELMNDIIKNKIFGTVQSNISVIEFQKRGLPHAHILIILEKNDKPRTTDDYDKIISAEIPDKTKLPLLYETIIKFNIHSPCNVKSTCFERGMCTKRFPRDFNEFTHEDNHGYPIYRRRFCESIKIGNNVIDNKWVVPYNPYISTKYNAHINVEICSTIKAVKYLYKYIYKGHDKIVHAISNNTG